MTMTGAMPTIAMATAVGGLALYVMDAQDGGNIPLTVIGEIVQLTESTNNNAVKVHNTRK